MLQKNDCDIQFLYTFFTYLQRSLPYIRHVIYIQNFIYALFVTSVTVTGQQSEKIMNIRPVGFIKENKAFE